MKSIILSDFQSQQAYYKKVVDELSSETYHIQTSTNSWAYCATGSGERLTVLYPGGMSGPDTYP